MRESRKRKEGEEEKGRWTPYWLFSLGLLLFALNGFISGGDGQVMLFGGDGGGCGDGYSPWLLW